MPYYSNGSPILPYPHNGSSMSSPNPNTNIGVFVQDGSFAPITPIYEPSNHRSNTSTPQAPQLSNIPDYPEGTERENAIEDDDSEGYTWEASRSPNSSPSTFSNSLSHRRSHSANEMTLRNAKRAHTVVERNYRERLNDKIADLALYLFETSSDCTYLSYHTGYGPLNSPILRSLLPIPPEKNYTPMSSSILTFVMLPDTLSPQNQRASRTNTFTARTKPSKSLVMTRAKERLKQLEARNKSLESEVVKLRQHIAILDHIVASKKDDNTMVSAPTLANISSS